MCLIVEFSSTHAKLKLIEFQPFVILYLVQIGVSRKFDSEKRADVCKVINILFAIDIFKTVLDFRYNFFLS